MTVAAGQVLKPPPVDNNEITSTSVVSRWAPPPDPNGEIILYTVNIMAVSSDPAAYAAMMGMGGGAGDRRRKRQTQGLNVNCILPGGPVGVEANINTTELSLSLTGLSKFECFVGFFCTVEPLNIRTPLGLATLSLCREVILFQG